MHKEKEINNSSCSFWLIFLLKTGETFINPNIIFKTTYIAFNLLDMQVKEQSRESSFIWNTYLVLETQWLKWSVDDNL